jgi:hypothetical protein
LKPGPKPGFLLCADGPSDPDDALFLVGHEKIKKSMWLKAKRTGRAGCDHGRARSFHDAENLLPDSHKGTAAPSLGIVVRRIRGLTYAGFFASISLRPDHATARCQFDEGRLPTSAPMLDLPSAAGHRRLKATSKSVGRSNAFHQSEKDMRLAGELYRFAGSEKMCGELRRPTSGSQRGKARSHTTMGRQQSRTWASIGELAWFVLFIGDSSPPQTFLSA